MTSRPILFSAPMPRVASGETATVTRSKVCAEAVIKAMKRRQ